MAAVICEALEEKARGYRPRSLGIGASGHTDTARKAGDGRPVRDQGISALTISSR